MQKWKRILSVLLLLAAVLTCFSPICEAESLDCGAKLLAITFDDGPGPYTAGLLDELAARGVKATFFVSELPGDTEAHRGRGAPACEPYL